ncbi:MAG: DUF6522 family protein [Pseudomonadota bacterium]
MHESASISIDNGDAVIDAATLAEWLNIDLETLTRGIESGAVRTLVEKGEGEDAGRMRLTARYGERQACMILEADGRLTPATPPPESQRPVKPSLMQLLDE